MLVKYKNYIIRLKEEEEEEEEEEEIATAAAPNLGIRNHPTGSPNICGMGGGRVWCGWPLLRRSIKTQRGK